MKKCITEVVSVLRSKNSGPFDITFDIMFKSREWFDYFCQKDIINPELICRLYGVDKSKIVSIVQFEPANAIKFTLERRIASGSPGETDIYGAQQHAPLLGLTFEAP